MKLTLTLGQAVSVHGWLAARQWLTWGDVLASNKLHFKAFLAAGVAGRCVGEEAAHPPEWQVNSDNELPKDSPKDSPVGHNLPTKAIKEIGGLVADKLRARYGDDADIGKRDMIDLVLEGYNKEENK